MWVHGSHLGLATVIPWHLFLMDMLRQGASEADVPGHHRCPTTFRLNDLANLVYKNFSNNYQKQITSFILTVSFGEHKLIVEFHLTLHYAAAFE